MKRSKSDGTALARPAIEPEEYDFSGVPKHELSDCVHYEYVRESESFLNEIKNLQSYFFDEAKRQNLQVGEKLDVKFTINITKRESFMFAASIVARLAATGKFENLPWQKLSASVKQALHGLASKGIQNNTGHLLLEHPPLRLEASINGVKSQPLAARIWMTDQQGCKIRRKTPAVIPEGFLVSGAIHINSNYTQQQIVDCFHEWLRTNKVGIEESPKERRGRHTERDKLNALGALRLRYHCRTLAEAQKLILPLALKRDAMQYSDRTAWNRACDSAIEHFHNLLQLPQDQLPRHFTKGWQK
jgi:hypothetical protein